MVLISLKNASKHYLEREFTLDIKKGELIIVSGKNGTGKSTLIKLIVGFISPDYGSIIKNTKKITFLPEDQELPEALAVSKYLKTMERIRKGYYNRLLFEDFKIPYNKKIFELSKGNKQKLAIVSSLIGNEDIYIFDEPLVSLDEKGIKVFVQLVSDLKFLGKAIIISTHNSHYFKHLTNKLYSI